MDDLETPRDRDEIQGADFDDRGTIPARSENRSRLEQATADV